MVHAIDFLDVYPITLDMTMFFYYFDCKANQQWHGTCLTKFKNLKTPQELRIMRHFAAPYINNGGYHFTWMGGKERVKTKSQSVVEGDINVKKWQGYDSEKNIENAMKVGVLPGDPNENYDKIPAEKRTVPYDVNNINLPYIKEFLNKYPQFLRPKE